MLFMSTNTIDLPALEPSWSEVLAPEFDKPYMQGLRTFLAEQFATEEVFPPREEIFAAFDYSPFNDVRVVILGQDPYHDNNQAHGLCFSVRRGIRVPPSLRNIFKELGAQVGMAKPSHGELTTWAQQGILMLNTVLTVRAHSANSHRKKGWEKFTDQVIRELNARREGLIFVLWGGPAKKKKKMIDADRHLVLESAHPSPLAARYGFFGNNHFVQINDYLTSRGQAPIEWTLPS